MVTGEDYNVLPFTTFNNILKIKAVNRTSSGISRYLDVIDSTGKYSSTNIFAQDGIIYKEDYSNTLAFQFTSSTEVNYVVQNLIKPLISDLPTKHLYYDTATRFEPTSATVTSGSFVITYAYKPVTLQQLAPVVTLWECCLWPPVLAPEAERQ
jgi:hypothetical protein